MDISKFLSKVIGLYCLIISIAMLINMPAFARQIQNLINNPSLMFVSGFFILIVGLLMIVSHNIWQWNWRVVITIIAWVVLFKAIIVMFFPDFTYNLSMHFVNNEYFAYGSAGVNLFLGLLLSCVGFRR